jgi:hypothetical protein
VGRSQPLPDLPRRHQQQSPHLARGGYK